jgi:hypothetical protein
VAVGLGGHRLALVEGLECSGKQEHRNAAKPGIGLDGLAELVAVAAGHHHVGQDDVRPDLAGLREGVFPIVDRDDREVFVLKSDRDDLLDRDAVVRQKKSAGHATVLRKGNPRALTPTIG